MNKKKGFISAGVLFMGLIVMLGLIGVVSGLWSKNLVINGTVETGDLNADWDCGWTNDDGLTGADGVVQGGGCDPAVVETTADNGADPDNNDWPNFNNTTHVAKDVGHCSLVINPDEDTGQKDFGNQVANVTIENAYPSYECTVTLQLTNTGSIPFNVAGAGLELPDASKGKIETVDASGDNLCDPSTLLTDPQVDPGEEKTLTCTVHVTQTAEQSDCTGTTTLATDGHPVVDYTCPDPTDGKLVSYSFGIKVCVAQWNEAATYGQCTSSDQHEGPDTNDFDADGVLNAVDNCPINPNPDQADADADGIGDVCEPAP